MPIPAPALATRADVYALELRLESKAILAFLLDQDARPFARDELAVRLGMKPHNVEVGIVAMQQRAPVLLSREGPDGERLGARFAFVVSDAPVRAAWANVTPLELVAHANTDTRALADVDVGAPVEDVLAALCEEAREAGEKAYDLAMSANRGDKLATLESVAVAVYTHARKQGKDKREAQKEADAVAATARAVMDDEERKEKEAARAAKHAAQERAHTFVPMGGRLEDPDDPPEPPTGDVGKQCSACKTQWVGGDVCPECGPTVEHPYVFDVEPSVTDDAAWQMLNDGTAIVREAPTETPPEVARVVGEDGEPDPTIAPVEVIDRDTATGQFQPRKVPKRRKPRTS